MRYADLCIPVLTDDEIRHELDPTRLLAALETAFRDRYPSVIIQPRLQIPTPGGTFLIMSCSDPTTGALGMKLITVRGAPPPGEPRVLATYVLLDPATSCPTATFPANAITELRTAATSALATKFLARQDAATLGIFGTGRQARAHLALMPLVRDFRRVVVCGSNPDSTRTFANRMSGELKLPVEPLEAATCAAVSDVLCTCTTSSTPLFDGTRLRPGMHLNLVGTFQTHCREVDSVTIERSRVVVDTYEGALAEAGDLLIPLAQHVITRDHILADLHQLVSQQKTVRRDADDITLFKSVGCALEDLVAAELLHVNPPGSPP